MSPRRLESNRDWEQWGERDPLWAVSTSEGKRRGEAWTEMEFYAKGKTDWASYLERWERYGLDRHSCVEIGCGTGRLTTHLAATFGQVWGLDVSPGMIAQAKQRITDQQVTFLLGTGDTLPLPSASISAAFSTFVFQHFDSLAHAADYLAEISRVLRPDGSALLPLPIHRWPWNRRVFELLHRALSRAGDARVWVHGRPVGLGARPVMRGLSYPQGWVFQTLQRVGSTEVEVSSAPASPGSRDPLSMLFARKPGGPPPR